MDPKSEEKVCKVALDFNEISHAHNLNPGEYALALQRAYAVLTFAVIPKEKWDEALNRFVDLCRDDLEAMENDPEITKLREDDDAEFS